MSITTSPEIAVRRIPSNDVGTIRALLQTIVAIPDRRAALTAWMRHYLDFVRTTPRDHIIYAEIQELFITYLRMI